MPDVNWQNPVASERFIEDAIWWQKEFDLDGSRIDAVKHVESLAVSNLAAKFKLELENDLTDYYLLGETAMGWNGDDLEDNLAEYETINNYLGDDGLVIYARSDFAGLYDLENNVRLYYLVLGCLLLTLLLVHRIVNSHFGMVIRGAKSNDRRMQAVGFPTFRYRLTCYVISGMICGLAGWLMGNLFVSAR